MKFPAPIVPIQIPQSSTTTETSPLPGSSWHRYRSGATSAHSFLGILIAVSGLAACGGGDGGPAAAAPNTTTSATSTAGVACGISGDEYNSSASVELQATYSWTCTGGSRALTANGVPNHPVGTFPGPGNPNRIAVLATSASYVTSPAKAVSPTTVITSGYGINGVKMEPATAGTCVLSGSNTSCDLAGNGGAWNIEALGQKKFNFGVDSNFAHVQPNGAYHYHGMPEGLITRLGGSTTSMTLVGWAPDGFPIYARNGYATANDAKSGLRTLLSSYRLKNMPDANRPATNDYPMGTFTQDYEYVAGLGDLDECNGRSGVTPEFPDGIYHYIISSTFPFIGRCVKGTPASIR